MTENFIADVIMPPERKSPRQRTAGKEHREAGTGPEPAVRLYGSVPTATLSSLRLPGDTVPKQGIQTQVTASLPHLGDLGDRPAAPPSPGCHLPPGQRPLGSRCPCSHGPPPIRKELLSQPFCREGPVTGAVWPHTEVTEKLQGPDGHARPRPCTLLCSRKTRLHGRNQKR